MQKHQQKKNELESFLGTMNILCDSIPNMADYVDIFDDIRRKNSKYKPDLNY